MGKTADIEKEVRAYEADNFGAAVHNLRRSRNQIVRATLSSEIQTPVGELTARLVEIIVALSEKLGTVDISQTQRAKIFTIWRTIAGDTLIAGEAIHNPITDPDEVIFAQGSYRAVVKDGDDYTKDRLVLSELSAEFRTVSDEAKP